jgi:Zn-dependent M28 family amino/carboxypeptidase
MGTASSMELVRYFAEHRTKRDIIVNLNNGEEDFLWGAKAYTLNHIRLIYIVSSIIRGLAR